MKSNFIIGSIIILLFLFLLLFFGLPLFIQSIQSPKPMYMKVSLNNLCTVHDETFMVMTRPYNRRAYFNNGIARIKVMSDWKVRLAANDKYPDFVYDGEEYSVKENLQLTADCGTSKRLKGIFGAFRNQFN